MESDWEIELGGGAPVIDGYWPGIVDLRLTPDRVTQLPEAIELPSLARALVQLNAPTSPVWTSKCDIWPVSDFDPDELDAPPEGATRGIACYIDLLPRDPRCWTTTELVLAWCKGICGLLRLHPLRCCRADFIVRHAILARERYDLGITTYLTACGQTQSAAVEVLASALAVFADTVRAAPDPAASQLQ